MQNSICLSNTLTHWISLFGEHVTCSRLLILTRDDGCRAETQGLAKIHCDNALSEQTQGGGNCANALTAAARLGLKPYLIAKIGDDGIGDGIVSELQADGVNTDYMIRAEGQPSPFTYIIVDREGTRPLHARARYSAAILGTHVPGCVAPLKTCMALCSSLPAWTCR